jgi:hypothetical protein
MLLKETLKNRTSSHSQPRGSNGGSSGLSNLFTADDLYTLEEEVVQTKKAGRTSSMRESDYKLPDAVSYQESYTYGSSFGYGNSFYQSYGESFHPSVEEKLLEAPIRQNSLNSIKSASNSTSKPFFTVKELISLIIRDATVQHTSGNSQADRKLVLDGEVDLLTKIDSLILVPAEEDGSPMDDLPSCPNHTDIFNLGVRDFLIMDRQTEVELIHIRIEGDISPNKPFDGSLAKNLHVVTDEGMYPLSLVREASNGTDFTNEEDFYTLQDDEDDEDADLIQAFRTDTDELLYHELQKVQDELKKKPEPPHVHKKTKDSHQEALPASANPNRNSVNASRLRSSSGNLMISYRRPGSERWRVAQKLAVLPENSTLEGTPPSLSSTPKFTVPLPPSNTTPNSSKKEVSAPIIIGRKEEVANEVRKQLEQKTGGVMPETSKLKQMLLNYNNSQKNLHNNTNNDLLPRRHSDRPYNEEIDGENSDNNSITYKYSRKYSTTSSDGNNTNTMSKSCTYTDLNPHTSLSLLSAQLSPAHSTLGENDRKDSGSDDDQLGLIKFDRRKGSMGLLSTKSNQSMDQTRSPSLTPSSLSGRSFAKDEARLPSSFFFPNLDGVSTPNSTPNSKVTPRLTNQKVSRNHLLRDSFKAEGGVEGEEQQPFPEEEIIKVKTYDQEEDDEEDEGWGEGSHNVDEQILKLQQQQQLTLTGSPATIARKKSLLQPKYPTHLYDNNYEENGAGGENGCGRSSENGSVKSGTSTRSGSVLSRLYDYFSSKKRPSLASESNDSVNSSSNPHLHNSGGSRRSSLQSRPSLYGAPPAAHPVIYEKQLQISKELPIIQNLDTGDVYTLGALKYSAKSLPETVSPETLFGTTPSATTVTTTTAEEVEKIDENGDELI